MTGLQPFEVSRIDFERNRAKSPNNRTKMQITVNSSVIKSSLF